jgi:NhaP-type Na+/H+ and K+/H+ antiporter
MNKKSPLFFTVTGIIVTAGAQSIAYFFDLSDTAYGLLMGVGIGLLLTPLIKKITALH